ncbi:PREDICTED: corepressor interacting with RBPJ 1 [Dufourea novaeangliae]|uniref:Corepressor interacting with RBPJ 1 n=1 Tax=Dufourea novaeangliae TaxID=178035 RepID=A0A154P0R5_DUFNO|nr:PREDICTED: corepressor interacting with RBPJ 1 [Dufourea novaeangliae]KZC04730.1 Corepressor interacting with RBPJ 1 [Dufourea novaeangliae]
MGKGFNNYMCKKFFHPASRDNLKRVWMAEQQAEAYKKKQEELRVQYEKEQDLHNNKALLSKESKDKLSVNFMYEPPPGAKKEREKEDNEPEYKFEWQRKYNAPRESYCKGDSEIRDQPFGIQVRNVRCIKCHKWGHINTDKECPLYSQAMSVVMANNSQTPSAPDALTLVQQMREDGLALKKSALNAQQHLRVPEHEHLMVSDDEEQSEITFLKTLSKKEKKKLLRKLQQLEKKTKKSKKKKSKRKSKKTKRKESSSDTDSDSSCSSTSSSTNSVSSSSNGRSDSSNDVRKDSNSNRFMNGINTKNSNDHVSKESRKARKGKHRADSKVSNDEGARYRQKVEKHKAYDRNRNSKYDYKKDGKPKQSHRRNLKKSKDRYLDVGKKRKIEEFDDDRDYERQGKKRIKRSLE